MKTISAEAARLACHALYLRRAELRTFAATARKAGEAGREYLAYWTPRLEAVEAALKELKP
ncbi:MAG: hypothetical protein ACXW2U_00830 [Telluria sp.]